MTYIVMPSVVCCADAFSAGKSRRNREKNAPNSPMQSRRALQGRLVEFQTLRQQSVTKQIMFPRQVSQISNAKATVRYEADYVAKAG